MGNIEQYKEHLAKVELRFEKLKETYQDTLVKLHDSHPFITTYFIEKMSELNTVFSEMLEVNSEISTLKYMIGYLESDDESDFIPF